MYIFSEVCLETLLKTDKRGKAACIFSVEFVVAAPSCMKSNESRFMVIFFPIFSNVSLYSEHNSSSFQFFRLCALNGCCMIGYR